MADAHALQRAFAAALTAPKDAIDTGIFRGDSDLARRRLRLYRGNVQANAHKALANAYPVCRQITGDAFFEGLANVYAARVPSRSGDLNEYGDRFADFLAGFPPAAEIEYLADVARLEWLVHRAHYAADASDFDVASLAAIPHERFGELSLTLYQGCALIASRWPLARLWQIHQPDYEGAFDADLSLAERVLVFRPHYRVRVRALDAGAFAFLSGAASGELLGSAVAAACAADPAFSLDVHLQGWIADRIIVDLALRAPDA
jgi:hypothetical protein